jgi:hypothetical protein
MTNYNSTRPRCERCRSYAINPEHHGRDNTRLDLCDVCYWRDRAETAEKRPERGQLALDVYRLLYEETETFEGELGESIAYLLGGILTGDGIQQLEPRNDDDTRLLEILQSKYPPEHELWSLITTIDGNVATPSGDACE